MSIQDDIYKYILKREIKDDVSAYEIMDKFFISRNTASHHLNRLLDEGKLEKTNSKPALFKIKTRIISHNPFFEVVGFDGSMSEIIAQCQAAVNYPNGLPMIIRGKSGTGKSLLAKEIYEYAKYKKVISEDAPYVILNCADYANNPELLSSILFGYVEGAFTGAQKEKKGILDEANGGYLFLDEVHNLTSENQEKLFLLMDSHKYKRLGENGKWQFAKVRLMMATTEDIGSTMLTTFRRRIPLEITIPTYSERPTIERYTIIRHFFLLESKNIKKDIYVDNDYIKSLVSASFPGNIGELKNKIKLSIASGYSLSLIEEDAFVTIPTKYILKKHNYSIINDENFEISNKIDDSKLMKIMSDLSNVSDFTQMTDKIEYIIFVISSEVNSSENIMDKEINSFFNIYCGKNHILKIKFILKKYGCFFNTDIIKEIKLLLFFLYNNDIITQESYSISSQEKIQNQKYLKVAGEIINLLPLNKSTNEKIITGIASLIYIKKIFSSNINSFIVMHGQNQAASLSATVNELLKDYIFDSIDMSIDVSTEKTIKEIKSYIKKINTQKGLIILVDMGSLERMYSEIKELVTGNLLIINNVSTAVALDVAMMIEQGKSVEEIAEFSTENFNVRKQYFEGISKNPNILVSSISGEEVALKIRDILKKYINENEYEILVIGYSTVLNEIEKNEFTFFKNTQLIVTTTKIDSQLLPIFAIEELVNGTVGKNYFSSLMEKDNIRKCTNDILKMFTIEGATERLKFLNPEKIINEVEKVIHSYEKYYKMEFPNFIKVNLFLHLSSLIERLLTKGESGSDSYDFPINNERKKESFIKFSNMVFSEIKERYNIIIPENEYSLIFKMIDQHN